MLMHEVPGIVQHQLERGEGGGENATIKKEVEQSTHATVSKSVFRFMKEPNTFAPSYGQGHTFKEWGEKPDLTSD